MDRSTSGELAPLPGSKDKRPDPSKSHDYQVQDLEDTSHMTTPKTSQLLICLGSLLLLAMPAFAQPVPTAEAANPPSTITGTPTLLLDQISNCDTFGSTSQFFPDFAGGSESADNFTVPAGMQWEINSVAAPGFYDIDTAGTASTANITFYADAGGLPGAAVCTYAGETITTGVADGNFTADLSSPCVLTEGDYWMSFQTILPFNGTDQWFWFNAFDNNAPNKAFQDPSDLFGTGCTSWDLADNCVGPNPNGADDLCMSVSGTESAATTLLEVPTLGQAGIAALLLGLMGAGLFVLRRRA